MARLNEPPAAPAAITNTAPQPGPESVDASDFEEVKRRFIRQNRELAKNNSSQSLRIRSLELEVSRLLADNLELRNQVLTLQNEVYTAQSHASSAAVRKIKEELQAKIAELNGIVGGIEDVQIDERHAVREKKPIEGNWRERQPLTELMRESQLPTITEDKLYPRRTLGADEIQVIRLSDHSSNESPDLGPPPIAHFDYEDPVKQASPLSNKASPQPQTMGEEDELPADFAVNLETRRKRKDGPSRLEIRRHSLLPQSPAKDEGETTTILRTGAKRKLSDRESEKPIKPPSQGDFTFSRKVPVGEPKQAVGKVVKDTTDSASTDKVKIQAIASSKPSRKVLGDKSVNMSPRKTDVRAGKPEKPDKDAIGKPAPIKPTSDKEPAPGRRRRISSIPLPLPQDEVAETIEIQPPPSASISDTQPETPAAPDLFSPTPSEPSARPEGRNGTPPPSDLSSLSMTTDDGTRPSRRARSAVNYAEPSLMTKMRRPDKKMLDAVNGLQDHRRAMSVSTDKKAAPRAVIIKSETVDDDDEAWKNLPAAKQIELGSPLVQKGDSDPLPLEQPPSPPRQLTTDQPSATSATISALMAGSRKRRQSSQQPLGTDIDAATKKLEELDLYEFKDSSSPQTDGSGSGKAASRSHRRHSSVPKDIRLPLRDDAPASSEGKNTGLNSGLLESGRSNRVANRRRSMML